MLTLTPLQSDNFTRANVSPLTSPWALDEANDEGFQILSDVCVTESTNAICEQYFTYADTPNDQYCSVTLVAAPGASSFFFIKVRTTDNGDIWFSQPGYRLYVTAAGAWDLYLDTASTHTALLSGSGLTISAGDTFTLAIVGTEIYAMHNSTQLGSVSDSTYASGSVQLGGEAVSSTSALQFSNFVMGSAAVASTYSISGSCGVAGATVAYTGTASGSVTAGSGGAYTIPNLANGSYTITPTLSGYTFSPTSASETVSGANITGVNFTATANPSGSLPFLGSVRTVSGVPSGQPNIFVGTFKIVGSAPAGISNPYLGHVNELGSAPSGSSNPLLGEVVIVAEPPAGGESDPWLGNVCTE